MQDKECMFDLIADLGPGMPEAELACERCLFALLMVIEDCES